MLFPLYDKNPHYRTPWLTLLIIAANVGIMVWLGQQDMRKAERVVINYGFVPKRLTQIDNPQPVLVEIQHAAGKAERADPQDKLVVQLPPDPVAVYGSLLSMMFLHGGWFHLVSNMWMLWIFGNNIEDRLGHIVYGLFYLTGGILASLAHWLADLQGTMPVIGASGAVAAVLGAYAVSYPTAKVRTLLFLGFVMVFDLPALAVLGFWFLMEVVQGLGLLPGAPGMNIAFWAHVGGFIAGVIMIPIFAIGATPPDVNWQQESDDSFQFD